MRTMAMVVSMFSTILVAVPALSRVDPVSTSGPTLGAMIRSTKFWRSAPGQQVTKMMRRPLLRARVSAPRTNGVRPLAETPTTTSFFVGRSRAIARAPFLVVVLDAFLRLEDRVLAAGHDRLHAGRRGAERRRHLGGLDDAEPAAGAGADEEDAAAAAQRLCDDFHAVREAVALAVDRRHDLAVFGDHQVDDLADGRFVECRGCWGLIASVGSDSHLDCWDIRNRLALPRNGADTIPHAPGCQIAAAWASRAAVREGSRDG